MQEAATQRVVQFVKSHPKSSALGLACFILLPGIVAVLSQIGRAWFPTGDVSHTELMLRAIPRHTPLVGVAARVGEDINSQGSTPGASMAYLLFPIYLLFWRSSFGLLVSVLVLHLAAIAGSLYLVRRFAGITSMLFMAVGFSVMVHALAPRFFLEPWNVWVPVFAFFVFLILIWGLVLGNDWCLPAAVLVGTHCLQTHISYVPLVVGLVGLSGIWMIVTKRRILKPLTWSLGISVLLWLPPIIEQLRSEPGNLTRLWQHFTDPPSATVGLRAALKAMVGELNVAGPFVTGPGKAPYDSPNLIGFICFAGIVIIGLWLAVRRRDFPILSLQGVMLATSSIGLWSAARVFGNFYDYVIRWMWVVAVMWMAVSVWSIWSWCRERPSLRLFPLLISMLLSGVVGMGAIQSVGAIPPYENDSRLVGGLAKELTSGLSTSENYLLRWHDPAALGGTGFGLLLELERHGEHIFVDQWAAAAARPYRVRQESDTDAVLWLIVGAENIERFSQRNDAQELATFDPRTNVERKESDDLRKRIEERFQQIGRPNLITLLDSQYGHMQILLFTSVPPDIWEMVARYSEIRLPGTLFRVPVGAPLYP